MEYVKHTRDNRSARWGACRAAALVALLAVLSAAAAVPAFAADGEAVTTVTVSVEVEPFRPPAGDHSVVVIVVDQHGAPVPGALVSLHKQENPVLADDLGRVTLTDMSGSYLYRVFAWKDGYDTWYDWQRCEGTDGETWHVVLQKHEDPVDPDVPVNPDTPDVPDNPDTPNNPDVPDVPDAPDTSGNPDPSDNALSGDGIIRPLPQPNAASLEGTGDALGAFTLAALAALAAAMVLVWAARECMQDGSAPRREGERRAK